MTLFVKPLGKTNSVRRGWFFSYLFVLAVPLILCLLLYQYSYHVIVRESEKSYGSTLEQLRIDLDAYLTEIQQVQERVLLDHAVQQVTSLADVPDANGQLKLLEAMKSLSSIQLNHPNISNVFVVLNGTDGVISSKGYVTQALFYSLYCRKSGFTFEEWKTAMQGSYPVWQMFRFQNNTEGQELWFLRTSMATSIGRGNATVVVCVRQDLLESRLDSFQWDSGMDLYAVGMDGSLVCQTGDPSEQTAAVLELAVTDQFQKVNDRMALVCASGYAGWRYILVLTKSLMMRSVQNVQFLTLLGLMFCTLLGLGLSRSLTHRNYQPLGSLVERYVPDESGTNPQLANKNEYEKLDYYVHKYYQERGDVQHALWNSEQALRRFFLYSLLQSPRNEQSIRQDCQRYDLTLDSPYYTVVLFSLEDIPEDKEISAELIRFAMLNIFEDAARLHFQLQTTDVGPYGIAIVGAAETSHETMALLEEDIRFTEQKILEYFHVQLRASQGGVHDGCEGLSASYSEALEAMSYLQAGEDADLICYRDICDARAAYTFPLETERRLIDLVSSGNSEQAVRLVRQTFPLGPSSAVHSPGVARCLAYDINSALIKGANQGGVENFENVRFAAVDQTTPDDIQRHLTRTAVTLCERVRLNRENANPNAQLCEDVKQYIAEHYQDPDLNISQTGLHFEMTPAYLSSIFKRETGESLLGYINSVRVEKVKELLAQGLPVSTIAEKTGFRDASALIRVFKKSTGVTPGSYRSSHLG